MLLRREKGSIEAEAPKDDEYILEKLWPLVDKNGLDLDVISSGVSRGADFGNFELADRFWRASLCIFMAGITHCFWERGAGFTEPWLFNARHSAELYIKGFIHCTQWLQRLSEDSKASSFSNRDRPVYGHKLYPLYRSYVQQIDSLFSQTSRRGWLAEVKAEELLIEPEYESLLEELDSSDPSGFRYRYPSLAAKDVGSLHPPQKESPEHSLQEIGWEWNSGKLLPKTGLPVVAGCFFDPTRAINSVHDLVHRLRSLATLFSGLEEYVYHNQELQREYEIWRQENMELFRRESDSD